MSCTKIKIDFRGHGSFTIFTVITVFTRMNGQAHGSMLALHYYFKYETVTLYLNVFQRIKKCYYHLLLLHVEPENKGSTRLLTHKGLKSEIHITVCFNVLYLKLYYSQK